MAEEVSHSDSIVVFPISEEKGDVTTIQCSIRKSDVYKATLDVQGKNVLTLVIAENRIECVQILDTDSVFKCIQDNIANRIKRRFLERVTGVDFKDCVSKFVITYKGALIAKAQLDALAGKLKLISMNKKYQWDYARLKAKKPTSAERLIIDVLIPDCIITMRDSNGSGSVSRMHPTRMKTRSLCHMDSFL